MSFDSALPGTAAALWNDDERMTHLPPLDLTSITSLVVVAAHPDDETLGAGGLIASCSALEIPVLVLIVTDGAASHPDSPAITLSQLAERRGHEVQRAVFALAPRARVAQLGYPDGHTIDYRAQIAADITDLIPVDATIVCPWRGDGHRDHRVVSEICAGVAGDREVLEYPIWMWHWGEPNDTRVPWGALARHDFDGAVSSAKSEAIAEHSSQVDRLGIGEQPMLTTPFLKNFARAFEVFVTTGPSEPEIESATVPASYFDDLYQRRDDPWRLATRWYETRKRALTVASLPDARYDSALEIGCSIGVLTEQLAPHCERLLAIDVSAAAVELARERVAQHPHVSVHVADAAHEFPEGTFDLVVLSEVGYYFARPDLDAILDEIVRHLSPTGIVLACHWRHEVQDYPLDGDEVQAAVMSMSGFSTLARHDEQDFSIAVVSRDDRSVARREGLL